VVFDDDRRFVAIGLWDPESPIRVKVLHQGKPVAIDADWFRGRLADAVARRRTLAASTGTPTATTGPPATGWCTARTTACPAWYSTAMAMSPC
jgi:23S rRNA (cytosine1962-C5)-methyltransferase